MSKFKKGLTVDRDVGDPVRRPRPVSQEGYYYPEEHVNDNNYLHPNSRRQPMRQYGSSASLEVRHEQNRLQREQEFFNSPSATPKPTPFENSRNKSIMQTESFKQTSDYQSRRTPNSREIPRSVPNSNSHGTNTSTTHFDPNQNSYHSNSPDFLAPQSRLSNNSRAPSPQHQIPPSNYYLNSTSQGSIQQQIRKNSPGPLSQNSMNLQSPSQESLVKPFVGANSRNIKYPNLHVPPGHKDQLQQYYYSSKNQNKTREAPNVDSNYTQNKTREAPIVDSNHTQNKTREVLIIDNNHIQNKTREVPILDNNYTQNDNNNNQRLNLPDPVSIEDYISQAIKYHEDDQLAKSTEYLRIAAEKGSAVGKVLYGIALRHGWGCKVNEALAFKHLQQAAESAITILNGINKTVSMSAFRGELVLAIYELGVCFRHGWGVIKSKATAAHYFEIAANMGDPDAQNDIAFCYYKGDGVKKDMKKAAKYYRMADAQGHGTMGNSWIYKEKYNNDNK
ncbi:hypothetical protein RclHR1_06280007 [Rhizophagus clarus]|uniref:HCP-like protein n=1 Tax=Rhizophagus clarus TaxID=94130 RepID=A0A2Z6RS63_9GLOM|nr:hypothetical protein RclHR1_06280007 [Rhizophagus clarus]GET01282.1 HCP-like protein [Rhizophagus clarus]